VLYGLLHVQIRMIRMNAWPCLTDSTARRVVSLQYVKPLLRFECGVFVGDRRNVYMKRETPCPSKEERASQSLLLLYLYTNAESGFDVRVCTIASAPISTHALIGR